MRIIAGSARGRKLFSPVGNSKKQSIRPTSDRCRESVFSILGAETLSESRVLDLFAGTGAMGLEAISRGAGEVVFVDNSIAAITLIKRNIQTLGFSSCQLIKRDITKGLFFLQGGREMGAKRVKKNLFDLVFLDPPYQKNYCKQVLTELVDNGLVSSGGTIVCEEHCSCEFPEEMGHLRLYDNRLYGDTGFWFYTAE